jgi:hypothetical protein
MDLWNFSNLYAELLDINKKLETQGFTSKNEAEKAYIKVKHFYDKLIEEKKSQLCSKVVELTSIRDVNQRFPINPFEK